jgi:hypothetical protein
MPQALIVRKKFRDKHSADEQKILQDAASDTARPGGPGARREVRR